jgi:hypothetical protein
MATKKSSRQKVILYGGPYHGQTVKLSESMSTKKDEQSWSGYTASITFTVLGESGRYVNGRWKQYEDPSLIPENIVLGDN